MSEPSFYEAAGNRFAVVETAAAVQDVLRGPAMTALALDGVLVCAKPVEGGDCRMEVVNRDGTAAEACGNGLRCLARYAFDRGLAQRRVTIETVAGKRLAEILDETFPDRVRTSMGLPHILALAQELGVEAGGRLASIVDMGNPHCVLFVDDVDDAPVAALGALLEHHPRFPKRTNVGFVEVRAGALHLRVWERGVGETAACGTGAGAAAAVAIRRGLLASPLELHLRGGTLRAIWDGTNELLLEGPVAPLQVAAK